MMKSRSFLPFKTALGGGFVLVTLVLPSGGALAQVSPEQKPFLESGRKAPVNTVKWSKVVSLTFDDPAELSRYAVGDGKWEISDGRLWAVEGEKNRSIFLTRPQGDNLRIEFEATNFAGRNGLIGDITLMLNNAPGKSVTGHGYTLTTGSFFNTCTTFYREGSKLARTEHSPVVSGKTNTVVIELYEGHLRYWLNDRIILEAWDVSPWSWMSRSGSV